MTNLASLLAHRYHVQFLTHPTSSLNPLLGTEVRLSREVANDAEIYIADVTFQSEQLRAQRAAGAKLIVCCHGLPDKLHGLSPQYVSNALELADKVVFVSAFQAQEFNLPPERYSVIPNATRQIEKSRNTGGIGTLGTLNEPRKGAAKTVAIGLRSNARSIHLWGMTDGQHADDRVVIHGWESDKNKIYESFDVLVFLSESETFGMVVIEAMSAGIPCVLSSLEAFQEFRACPGIVLVTEEELPRAHEIVNDLLLRRQEIREKMIAHWQENYSPGAILEKWGLEIGQLSSRRY